jgi:starch phosphorylase
MKPRKYVVVPPVKSGLESLREIARNLWFSWNSEAFELFNHLDAQHWEETNHNPLQVLIRLSRSRIRGIREDEGYMAHAEKVRQRLRAYMNRPGSYDFNLDHPVDFTTAYFSLEFGLAECLPIYSGGLGLLAGDHLKSASDLNLPLTGVGLMYGEGYFSQSLTSDGWQQEVYPRLEFDTLPLERQTAKDGSPLRVFVELGSETVALRVLKVNVGRVPLYLLDADIPENPSHLRMLTSRLYGGDTEMRIKQELVLGVGGCRALAALGIRPTVFHLNEGHAAFTLAEQLRMFVQEKGLSLAEAREMVTAQSVLTIHTPVPAGNDVFPPWLVKRYLGSLLEGIGMDFEKFMALGRKNPLDQSEGFWMPVLGLKMTGKTNGVSKLHATVAKGMWSRVWKNVERNDVPIVPITNGVHIPSHISRDLAKLYDRYLGPGWTEDPDNEKIWNLAENIPDIELWRTHERCRSQLVNFARRRLSAQFEARGASLKESRRAAAVLDPDALTICFARRFATYKRATLLLRDLKRLAQILNDSKRPVQVIFAGKAHPADDTGKDLIRRIIQTAKQPPFRDRIVFLENYDINVAKHMVQGADVWLNTPRRPLEACGTSGMKASANGALNLSVMDGWWDEGFTGDNGWAIGRGEEYDDPEYQDEIESKALYDTLEESVKPLYYDRGADDLPREWIRMMKRCIGTVCPGFNSHRMVTDYVEQFYVPAARNAIALSADDFSGVKDLVTWKDNLRKKWHEVRVIDVDVKNKQAVERGREATIEVTVQMPELKPDDLLVEVLHGPLNLHEEFTIRYEARLEPSCDNTSENGSQCFSGMIPLNHAGRYGYAIRITPRHPYLAFSHKYAYVEWG